jgi:hypothetical protein
MPRTQSLQASVERFYAQGVTAIDVAECLASFDAQTPASTVRAFMKANDFDRVGVRRDGLVMGYVSSESLKNGACGDSMQEFTPHRVMPASAPIFIIISLLDEVPCVFVTVLGHVGGIITREDIGKPPVRMWLFGVVTMLEMAFNRLLESRFPNNSWTEHLSPSRLAKAQALFDERERVGEPVTLIESLYFTDKAQILFAQKDIRDLFNIPSRMQAKRVTGELKRLRDSLAHSGDILTRGWDVLVRICGVVDLFPHLIDMA